MRITKSFRRHVRDRLATFAQVLAQHTDGAGLGLAYEAFTITQVALPAAFRAAIAQAGFSFDPMIFDSSGWMRYPAQDRSFTVAVEGWGDHCLALDRRCTRRDFAVELAARHATGGEEIVEVAWPRIPLTLYTDRGGEDLDPPLKFRAVSLTAVAGYHPHAPGEDPL